MIQAKGCYFFIFMPFKVLKVLPYLLCSLLVVQACDDEDVREAQFQAKIERTRTVLANHCTQDSDGSNCTKGKCRDGIIDAGEECDDGNTMGGDGCDPMCKREAIFECDENPFAATALPSGTTAKTATTAT